MINNIFPEEWKKEKLSDVGYSFSGLRSKSKKDFDENGNAKFVNYRNINRNYFVDPNDLAPVHVGDNENQNYLLKGDVLFTGSSETPEEVAFSSVMREEIKDLYLNSFSFGYRFNNLHEFLPEFYAYFFRGPYFRKIVFPLAQGSTRYNISKNEILKIEVPIPPFTEQQKIAAILSSVDEAINVTENIIQQLEIVKKGIIHKLFTKGVENTEYRNSQIGEIPSHWKIIKLKDISKKITKGSTPTTYGFEYTDEGINFIKIESIDDNGNFKPQLFSKISKEAFETFERSQIKEGDLLISIAGNLGRVAIAVKDILPANTNQAISIVRIDKGLLDIKFLYYYLKGLAIKRYIRKVSTVGAQPNLSLKQIGEIEVPKPKIDEQRKIVEILNNLDDRILNNVHHHEALQSIKKGLMQQLLTGKVRIPMNENEEVPQ